MSSVSVVICVKNKKYELRKSLNSLFEQTVYPEEVIVVDASTDNSTKDFVKDELTVGQKYILLPSKDGEALDDVSLFEIGLKEASSDYVLFFAAGDLWEKDKIELVKKHLDKNPGTDICLSSFKQTVRFEQEEFLVDDLRLLVDGHGVFFLFWLAPSAFAVRTRIASVLPAMPVGELKALNFLFIPQSLSLHYYGAQKDFIAMEKSYWERCFSRIQKMNAVKEAVLFCMSFFRTNCKSVEVFESFCQNVGLPQEEAQALRPLFKSDVQIATDRKQQNYLLMRDWLELKISGRSVGDKLLEKGFSSVLIYGAGKHGSILFNDLKGSIVKVLAWLDKNTEKKDCMGLPVFSPKNLPAGFDKKLPVIVTPYLEFDVIKQELESFGFKNCVSLKDMIV